MCYVGNIERWSDVFGELEFWFDDLYVWSGVLFEDLIVIVGVVVVDVCLVVVLVVVIVV